MRQLSRRSLLMGLIALAACAAPSGRVALMPGTTLIVIRHADRTGDDLNAVGRARAAALVAALESIEIDAIYSPGIKRNLDTAAPLAAARGVTVRRIPADNPAAQLAGLAAGKSAVWVGNKGNLNAIWDSLGAPDPPPLDYGDLYIVTRGPFGQPRVDRRRYGP